MADAGRLFKSALTYGGLVVPPFVVLLLILRAGDELTPPRSIGGTWTVEHATAPADACPALPNEVEIAQSGPRAELVAPEARVRVSLQLSGTHVHGSGRARASDECQLLELDAQLSDTDKLDGTLRHKGCDRCPPLAFHAVRKPRVKRATGH